MAKSKSSKPSKLTVEAFKHEEATRTNIPTAEYQSVMREDEKHPIPVTYRRGLSDGNEVGEDPLAEEKAQRNRDLDPQLVWCGKDQQDWSDLVVQAPPLYIQEKVHPKAIIDDLQRWSVAGDQVSKTDQGSPTSGHQLDLFADFNGIPEDAERTDFYRHEGRWSNRMILGDSLQVMATLAEREGLRGKVQSIYLDPPYGIKFNSNFQWSTTSRDVKDGKPEHITREPEQVKAFRDTWRYGIHSYLTVLRDRLTVARDLLTESGSIFVQIGDENVHRVRAVMDEVFGSENCVSVITLKKTAGQDERLLNNVSDYILWFARAKTAVKFRDALAVRSLNFQELGQYTRIQLPDGKQRLTTREDFGVRGELQAEGRPFRLVIATSSGHGGNTPYPVGFEGQAYFPTANRHWSTHAHGFQRLIEAGRIAASGETLAYVRFFDDFIAQNINNIWTDTGTTTAKKYVVETGPAVVQRCILMSTDPGDLVLDPTCGSGTTAYVAEQWGRRWITIDTSRVALALARARIMGARYAYYLLADSRDGQRKEAELRGGQWPVAGGQQERDRPLDTDQKSLKHGFVYERVPHITLKSIANNAEIDVIWDKWQQTLEPLRMELNAALRRDWEEWQIPREPEDPWPETPRLAFGELKIEQAKGSRAKPSAIQSSLIMINKALERSYTLESLPERPVDPWPEEAVEVHSEWWGARIARQREIDASIAAKADFEYLYDKPYGDKKTVRVAGPFTVESLSPHRVLGLDEDDELIDPVAESQDGYGEERDFVAMILDNLKNAGVQQAHKEDRIDFTALTPWPGEFICAEGRFSGDQWPLDMGTAQTDEGTEKRAAILIGPEFGTVSRLDLVEAAREAGDAGFDLLIACAFNYDAHSSEFAKLGRIPVLKARMNADLHMAEDLKNSGKGNLFVVFGEPDIEIQEAEAGQIRVKVQGVDVFHPSTGEVRSDGPEGIACWMIDTDYNQEAFFVRHAYFLGANDPYKALKTTLKAEIDPEAWASLNSDTSRPFPKPLSGRIAVKVINHLGDEVMKVFRV